MPTSRSVVVGAVFLLQIALLTIGITRDYRLKHEDNNALHTTFARSHLQLGLDFTLAQNYFHSPATGEGGFYANHPPGPGLVLAVVYSVTGHDGPFTTRATAIVFHMLGAWFFYGLVRRLMERPSDVILAVLLFAILPESAFFGRMMNHEILVLPAAILLVRGYWESVHGEWPWGRWVAAMGIGSVWAALSGWAGFFVIGVCALHAGWEVFSRRNLRARTPLRLLLLGGSALFAFDLAHLMWVLGGDAIYLRRLLASRMGADAQNTVGQWLGRIFELHWRYFGLTSALGLGALAYRTSRGLALRVPNPPVEVGSIFLIAGAAYVATFNFHATAHDYWQFLLLPASVISIVLVLRYLSVAIARARRRWPWRALLVVAILDITVTTAVTLVQRHTKSEGYCLEAVAGLRREYL